MNRCAPLLLPLALCALSLASAQTTSLVGPTRTPTTTSSTSTSSTTTDGLSVQRKFPQTALRGGIVFRTPPAITLNGVNTLMAPSYRIHGTNNLLVMSAQLVGGQAIVDYTTDLQGAVHEVWILTPAEAAKLWPTKPSDAAAWTFDPATQTWTKP